MLALAFVGGWIYFVGMGVLMVVATAEYGNLMKHLGWRVPVWLLSTAVFLLLLAAQFPQQNLIIPAFSLGVLASILFALCAYERAETEHATADLIATLGGLTIIGWLGMHFILLRHLDVYGERTILVFVIVWVADSFAYLVGRQFGRHRLAPRLSPKKSIEGYVGGIVFSLIAAGLFTYVVPSLPLWPSVALALFISVLAPAGDVAISMLKRESGVKDTGHIFPGHGGVLDRFDALLWGVTLGYYVLWLGGF
jgi:phosphatidate cytidylyltransferase